MVIKVQIEIFQRQISVTDSGKINPEDTFWLFKEKYTWVNTELGTISGPFTNMD